MGSRLGFAGVALGLIALGAAGVSRAREIQPLGVLEHRLAAVRAIPVSDRPLTQKVYNCRWGLAPYLLYARPDLRWVDALDPLWLHQADPERSRLKAALLRGEVLDSWQLISQGFSSRYVFCEDEGLNRELSADDRMERIHPKGALRAWGGPQVYRLRDGTEGASPAMRSLPVSAGQCHWVELKGAGVVSIRPGPGTAKVTFGMKPTQTHGTEPQERWLSWQGTGEWGRTAPRWYWGHWAKREQEGKAQARNAGFEICPLPGVTGVQWEERWIPVTQMRLRCGELAHPPSSPECPGIWITRGTR